jgi:hypothetical protein
METIYFALGIASVFVTALAVATIWAVIKVIKLKDLDREFDRIMNVRFNELEQYTHSVQNELSTRISNTDHLINTRIDKVIDVQDTIHQEGRRYVDSRIDKLLNDPKFCLNNKSTKQLIKG